MTIAYATGNPVKLHQATAVCVSRGITLEQVRLDLEEVQSKSGELIAQHKASQAFEILGKPVLVSDDSWNIPGLNGFPGPYMRYVNEWFTPEDWLRLTKTLADRRIMLQQTVVYQDANIQKTFSVDLPATLLPEIRGTSLYPHSTITSYDGGLTSAAEHHEKGKSGAVHVHNPWHDFSDWYIKTFS